MPSKKVSLTLREFIEKYNLEWLDNPKNTDNQDRGWFVYNEIILITVYNQGGYGMGFSEVIKNMDKKFFMPNADIMDFSLKYDLSQDL